MEIHGGVARQVLLIGALCVLGLAVNHFLLHSVLFTDSLLRWFLF